MKPLHKKIPTMMIPLSNLPQRPTMLALAAVALALILGGCASATIKPATVTENSISNPQVGFKGYELPIPPGYTVVRPDNTPPDLDVFVKLMTLEWKGTFGAEGDKKRLVRFEESFLIHNDKAAFLFGVLVGARNVSFGSLSDQQGRQLLTHIIKFSFQGQKGVEKSIFLQKEKKGLHAQVSNVNANGIEGAGDNCAEFYLVLGPLNDMYFLSGMSKMANREELQKIGLQMFNDLKFKADQSKGRSKTN